MTEIKLITCPKCNSLIPEHLGQCTVCGEQLKKCPICGKIYGSNAKFCPKDGSQLIYKEKASTKNATSDQPVYTEQEKDSNPQSINGQVQSSDQGENPAQGPIYNVINQFPNNKLQHNNTYNPNSKQQKNAPNKPKKAPVVGIAIAICVIAVLCIVGIFAFQKSEGKDATSAAESEGVTTTSVTGNKRTTKTESISIVNTESTVTESSLINNYATGTLEKETSKNIDTDKQHEDDGAYVLWSNKKYVKDLYTIKIYTPGGYLLTWSDDTRELLYLKSAGYTVSGSFEILSTRIIKSDINTQKSNAEKLDETITDEQTCETDAGPVHYIAYAGNSSDQVHLNCWLEYDEYTSLSFQYSTEGKVENLKDTEKIEQIIKEIFDCVGQKPDDTHSNKGATKLFDDGSCSERDENGAYVLEPEDFYAEEFNISNVSIYPPDYCILNWIEDDHTFLILESDGEYDGYYSLDPSESDQGYAESEIFEYRSDYITTDQRSCETAAGTVYYIAAFCSDPQMITIHSWLPYDDRTTLVFDFSNYDDPQEKDLNDTEKMEKIIQNAYSGVVTG